MKVFMIGGTGLLGCAAAQLFIDEGHEVKSIALPPLPQGAPIPPEMGTGVGQFFGTVRRGVKRHDGRM